MSLDSKLEQLGISPSNQGDITLEGRLLEEMTVTSFTMDGTDTLTALQLLGGWVELDPDGADRALYVPTASNMFTLTDKSRWVKRKVGSSYDFILENIGSAGEIITITANTGTTLDPILIKIAPGQVVLLRLVKTANTPTYTIRLIGAFGSGGGTVDDVLNVTTLALDAGQTLTGDQLVGGLIIRSGADPANPVGEIVADTMPTAVSIIAAMASSNVNDTFYFRYRNINTLNGDSFTLNGGVGITYDPDSLALIPIGKTGHYACRVTSATTVTIHYLGMTGTAGTVRRPVTAYSTAGNLAPIPAAQTVDGVFNRDPNGAVRTDTTATATQLLAQLGDKVINTSFDFQYTNTSNADLAAVTPEDVTLASGVGVTFKKGGTTATTIKVKIGQTVFFRFVCTSAATPTFDAHVMSIVDNAPPYGKMTLKSHVMVGDDALTVPEVLAGHISVDPGGAARTLTMPSVTLLIAELEFKSTGISIPFWIENVGDGADEVITLAIPAGGTLSPVTQTIAPGYASLIEVLPSNYEIGSLAITFKRVMTIPVNKEERVLVPTALATAGAGTYTAALIYAGWIQRDPAGADRADTFDTAANIIAALDNPIINSEFEFTIENTADADETLTITAGGVGVTLNGTTVYLKSGQIGAFKGVVTAPTTVTIYPERVTGKNPYEARTVLVTDSTAGVLAITGAMVAGGHLKRDAAGGDRDDTLPTVANLILALQGGAVVGSSFRWIYENISDLNERLTLITNTGWTLDPATAGAMIVDPGEALLFNVRITAAATATLELISRGALYPISRINETAATLGANATPTGLQLIGGILQYDPASTNRLVTLPTAPLTIQAMGLGSAGEDFYVGAGFEFYVHNSGNDGAAGSEAILTLTTNTGWTLDVEDATIQPGQIKKYGVKVTAATTATIIEIDSNVNPQCGFVRYENPIAAEVISIVAALDPIADGAMLIAAQPDYPRTLRMAIVDANSSITAGTVTFVGVDINGVVCTEVFNIANGGTLNYDTADAYASVTSVTVAGLVGAAAGDTISVGVRDEFGLPCRRNGVLLQIYKTNQDDANAVTGAIDNEYCHTVPPAASNAALDFSWWYEYI